MLCTIKYTKNLDPALLFLKDKLPLFIWSSLEEYFYENCINVVNEIRIKGNGFISLIVNSCTRKTDIYVDASSLNDIFTALCDGSVYAHATSILDGYISLGKGLRAGICGRAVIENGCLSGVCDITSINIRIPQRIFGAGKFIYNILKENSFKASVLIYSPPGVGKTTVLRDLACLLSKADKPIRHAIIDSREEITPFISKELCSDIYLSYPKGLAIELATKSMTPEIILCDEISSLEEADGIKKAIGCGVFLVASAHAGSFDELKSKSILKGLIDAKAFNYAVGLERGTVKNTFIYTVDKL